MWVMHIIEGETPIEICYHLPVIRTHITGTGVWAGHVLRWLHTRVRITGLIILEVWWGSVGSDPHTSDPSGARAPKLLVHLPGGGIIGHRLLHWLHLLDLGLVPAAAQLVHLGLIARVTWQKSNIWKYRCHFTTYDLMVLVQKNFIIFITCDAFNSKNMIQRL